MRRVILWIAAILITFAIGVGADQLWWHFPAAPAPTPKVETLAVDLQPQREIVYVSEPAPPPPEPKPNLILDYDPARLQLYGLFYVMGSKPKEFADLDALEVSLSPESKDFPGIIFVLTHEGEQHYSAQATFGLVTERRLFFATSKPQNGEFEYRFDGEFLRTDFEAVAGKNKAVLRGTLTRMKNGRSVAQREFTFRMEFMGC